MPHGSVHLPHHCHFHQRDRPVQHRLQMRGHAIAVQREAPDDQVRVPVKIKEVATGLECGISLVNFNDIQVGDIIETFTEIEVEQKL